MAKATTCLIYSESDMHGCPNEKPGCKETCELGPGKNNGCLRNCRAYHYCGRVHTDGGVCPDAIKVEIPTPVMKNGCIDHWSYGGRKIYTDQNRDPLYRGKDGKFWIQTHAGIIIGDLYQGPAQWKEGDESTTWLNGVIFERRGRYRDFKAHKHYLRCSDAQHEVSTMLGDIPVAEW